MADYLDKMNEQEEPSIVQEPVIPMNVRQTKDFFDKHYDANASIENGMPLHEGCDLLRARIEKKMYEKNRVQGQRFYELKKWRGAWLRPSLLLYICVLDLFISLISCLSCLL